MSVFEKLYPCERAEIYNAAPQSPLGFLPVCKWYKYFLFFYINKSLLLIKKKKLCNKPRLYDLYVPTWRKVLQVSISSEGTLAILYFIINTINDTCVLWLTNELTLSISFPWRIHGGYHTLINPSSITPKLIVCYHLSFV